MRIMSVYFDLITKHIEAPLYKWAYSKSPKISDTRKFAVITLKVEQDGFSLEKCIQKMLRKLQTV